MIESPIVKAVGLSLLLPSTKRICPPLRYLIMRQCLTILIGIVVLLSTTGLPRVQHLCGGIVQSAGIWLGTSGCDHEIASTHSCTAHAFEKHEQHNTPPSCCTSQASKEASKQKSCCTDQVDWEPSQLDLAIGDDVVLAAQPTFGFTIAHHVADSPISRESSNKYARPPPPWPAPQSRRRALLQVYRC